MKCSICSNKINRHTKFYVFKFNNILKYFLNGDNYEINRKEGKKAIYKNEEMINISELVKYLSALSKVLSEHVIQYISKPSYSSIILSKHSYLSSFTYS